jgi:hypothetical protein
VEVDEAEDYEAPGSNPDQELSKMKIYFSIGFPIVLMAQRGPELAPTPSSDI